MPVHIRVEQSWRCINQLLRLQVLASHLSISSSCCHLKETLAGLDLDDGRQSATPAPPSSISQRRKSTVSQNDYADAHMSLVNKVIVLGVSSLPFRVSLGCISKYDSNTQRLEIDLTSTKLKLIWE
ncbi:hypothetical protein GQ600_27328 [Phytophthora cactorum]|nr:hypothetical protein GQ600_27328 [Phytophthora cactorum]